MPCLRLALYAQRHGGRWNPPGSFPVVYLNRDTRVARANVLRRFAGRPYGPELLRPEEGPDLVTTILPRRRCVDLVSDAGCTAVGLPETYPHDATGNEISWDVCQPIGLQAWQDGKGGIACRSAAISAPPQGEELAWFSGARSGPLVVRTRMPFDKWFWT